MTNEDCIYCGAYADTRDHFIPWSYNHVGKRKNVFGKDTIERDNIYPSCKECNCIAGNKIFNTLEDKREYIQECLENKYRKILEMPDWTEKEIKELGYNLRNTIRIKVLAKQWIINRIAYPNFIYPTQPIQEELSRIQKALYS